MPLRPSAKGFITQSDHGFQREKTPYNRGLLSRFNGDELAGGDIRHAGIGEFARLHVGTIMDDPDPQPFTWGSRRRQSAATPRIKVAFAAVWVHSLFWILEY